MTSVLVLYRSRSGHTARIARRMCDAIDEAGGKSEMMDVIEAIHEGVDLDAPDVIALGAPVYYGTYDDEVFEFVETNREKLEAKPHSFFNISVTARTPEKATVEGNRYMQKVLERSSWQPRDLKVLAGKVDYPSWGPLDTVAIQMIMKFTGGPTDRHAVIDYTDWDDVAAYGRYLMTLA
jgi:menaquinone-dependent protoporphyrinogen oxidase